MLIWVILGIAAIPLLLFLYQMRAEKQNDAKKLEAIQRRLKEIEKSKKEKQSD